MPTALHPDALETPVQAVDRQIGLAAAILTMWLQAGLY